MIREIRPHIIINAAAYTAVDQAEKEEGIARAINTEAPAIIAEEAKKIGAGVVHYSTDYVFGFPLTYGIGEWQFELSYAHLSSHLGDERARRDPISLDNRINYVRDSFVYAASVYVLPIWRQYGELGWAFNHDGGAQPFEMQFGTELSAAGPTGNSGSPFLAVNAHLREEHNFGGDLTVQTGWLWRGLTAQTGIPTRFTD